MLAATTKLGLLARFFAVLTTVLSVRTVPWIHALATGVGAFIRVSHERITSRSLYAPAGRITTPAPGDTVFDLLVHDMDFAKRQLRIDGGQRFF